MQKSEGRAKEVRPFANIALGEDVGRAVCVPDGLSGRSALGSFSLATSHSPLATALSPQHNRRSIAHYLPFVYYYLVGISFETGTRSEWETPRPSLLPRGWGTQSLVRIFRSGHPPGLRLRLLWLVWVGESCCLERRASNRLDLTRVPDAI